MRSLVIKELRGASGWALLILGVLGVGIFAALGLGEDLYPTETPLTRRAMGLVTAGGVALAGLTMGLVQFLREQDPSNRALLLHRPLSPTRIFWSKVIAGLLLYGLAVGIPLISAIWWSATPGTFPAPFDWRFALPRLADALTGVAYYFAGVLTACRAARWLGSRGLGVFAGVVATWLSISVGEFWQAALATGMISLILAAAAWSSFVHGGEYAPQPRVGKIALGWSLLLGFVGLVYATPILSVWMLPDRRVEKLTWESYQLLQDGRVMKVTNRGSFVVGLRDLQNRPLSVHERPVVSQQLVSEPGQTSGLTRPSYRSSARVIQHVQWSDKLIWYFHRHQGYYVGFDVTSGRRHGWLGPQGFVTDGPPSSFPGVARQVYPMLITSQGVYQIDFHNKKVTRLRLPEHQVISCGSGTIYGLALATTKRVLFHVRGEQYASCPLPPGSSKNLQVSLIRAKNQDPRFFLWVIPDYHRQPSGEIQLYECNLQGQIVRHLKLPMLARRLAPRAPVAISALAAPAVFGLIDLARGGRFILAYWPRNWQLAYWVCLGLWALVGGIASAWITTRYRRPWVTRVTWVAIGLLLGLVGLFWLLALRDWPALQRCHQCRKPWPVDQRCCPNCSTETPTPKADGTQIF